MLEVDGATVVARELKRPLLELRQLALGFDGNGPDDEKIRIKMVNVADAAMRQVNDLVKLGELGDGNYEMEPVAVRCLCDDVIKEISKLFGKKKCQMTVRYSNRSRLVVANSELLKSVVYNFLMDATYYTGDNTKAELKLTDQKGYVRISVRDFGPALPNTLWNDLKGALIKPQEIAMRPGSSVLGLYIASKFSKYMNAEVGAVRHRDGASFFVKLPVSKQLTLWGG